LTHGIHWWWHCTRRNNEVRRIKKLLANLIVSPSHEALLPNDSPQNFAALAEAALE